MIPILRLSILSALALALLPPLLRVPTPEADEPAPRSPDPALEARPAPGELPALPSVELPEPPTAPSPATLERDSALADRFTAQGQRVRYGFAARAGELSIFELATTGFARGWRATAALRVVDPAGAVLSEQRIAGGVQSRLLMGFLAPAEGSYVLELSAEEEYFRYALVRHSSYAPRRAEPVRLDLRERVHGWLADGSDEMRFLVPARAGESLALKVEGTREEARSERRAELAARLDGPAARMGGMQERSMRAMGGRGAQPLFPELQLEIVPADAAGDGVQALGPAFARLLPEQGGLVEVRVRSAPGSQAALFDLVVQRAEPTHTVHGIVVDGDDEPCAGIELSFLREPDMDPWTRATSDEAGLYRVELPIGDYRVQLQRPGGEAVQTVRAGVARATELNLLVTLP